MENDALDYRQQLPMTHMYAVEWNLSDSIEMGCEKQISRAFQSIPPYSVPYNNSVLSTTLSTMVSIRGSLAAHTTTGVLLCVEGPSQAQVIMKQFHKKLLPPFLISGSILSTYFCDARFTA